MHLGKLIKCIKSWCQSDKLWHEYILIKSYDILQILELQGYCVEFPDKKKESIPSLTNEQNLYNVKGSVVSSLVAKFLFDSDLITLTTLLLFPLFNL